jgi:hypothetical protein
MSSFSHTLFLDDTGQDIAEYAVMVAVILLIVVGIVPSHWIKRQYVFSNVASAIQ